MHRIAIGVGDLKGDDFSAMFARCIEGVDHASPLGIADVGWNRCAWSVKTVKANNPFRSKKVRLISGRNSPDYSSGIQNPHEDIQATGRAVLEIWNARLNEALSEYDDMRIVALIRNIDSREFVLFEEEATRYIPEEFIWSYTSQGNLQGKHKLTGKHAFTWQFHGGQFTIIREVPASARQFVVARNQSLDVSQLTPDAILTDLGYTDNWIDIVQ